SLQKIPCEIQPNALVHSMTREEASGPLRLTPVHLWVGAAALLNIAGWGLSLLGQLNALGYGLILVMALAVFVAWHVRHHDVTVGRAGACAGILIHKLRRRFKRPLPLCF